MRSYRHECGLKSPQIILLSKAGRISGLNFTFVVVLAGGTYTWVIHSLSSIFTLTGDDSVPSLLMSCSFSKIAVLLIRVRRPPPIVMLSPVVLAYHCR